MKHPPLHIAIARELGVTPATLLALLATKAKRGSMNRGAYLYDLGLTAVGDNNNYVLTEKGADLLTRARILGY